MMFNSNDMVISPSILTFITTFKCTAACKDCCFAEGIVFGMLSFVILKVLSGKFRDVTVVMYVLAVLFVLKFFAG